MFRLGMLGLFALSCALTFAPRSAYAEQTEIVTAKGVASASSESEAKISAIVDLQNNEEQISNDWEAKGYYVEWGLQTTTVVKNADGSYTGTSTAVGRLLKIP